MLPHSDDQPAPLAKRLIYASISGLVVPQLRCPIGVVAFGNALVLFATVPEAAIHKHGQLEARKRDIHTHPYIVRLDEVSDPITKPPPMKC